MGSLLASPPERASGLVIVPGQHTCTVVPREHSCKENRRRSLAGSAFGVDDADGSCTTRPVLGDGGNVSALGALGLTWADADSEPDQEAAPAFTCRFLTVFVSQEGFTRLRGTNRFWQRNWLLNECLWCQRR